VVVVVGVGDPVAVAVTDGISVAAGEGEAVRSAVGEAVSEAGGDGLAEAVAEAVSVTSEVGVSVAIGCLRESCDAAGSGRGTTRPTGPTLCVNRAAASKTLTERYNPLPSGWEQGPAKSLCYS
jgi:hypothetical protein